MAKRQVEDRDRFMKFYPSDWRGDEELRVCSLAARGLWIELMCLAHKHGGVVLIAGEIPTEAEIAKQVGGTKSEVTKLIAELLKKGVASRRQDGALFSRRMVKDAQRREINKANGEKGGNPSLRDSVADSVGDLLGDSVNQNDNPQKPETRSQIPEHHHHRSRSMEESTSRPRPVGVDDALSALLDRAGIKQHDRGQWFAGARLLGDALYVRDGAAEEWVTRHFLPALCGAHGRALTVSSGVAA